MGMGNTMGPACRGRRVRDGVLGLRWQATITCGPMGCGHMGPACRGMLGPPDISRTASNLKILKISLPTSPYLIWSTSDRFTKYPF